jgi:hypothetical protein
MNETDPAHKITDRPKGKEAAQERNRAGRFFGRPTRTGAGTSTSRQPRASAGAFRAALPCRTARNRDTKS